LTQLILLIISGKYQSPIKASLVKHNKKNAENHT